MIDAPPLPSTLTPEKFRQIIAGLVDPDANPENPGSSDEYRDAAESLYLILATHFNRKALDAKTLWTRIASGVTVACRSVPDGDVGRFVEICLKHVQARESMFAADEEASAFLMQHDEMSPAWRQGFIRWLDTHGTIATVYGRCEWEKGRAGRDAKWARLREQVGVAAEEESDSGEIIGVDVKP